MISQPRGSKGGTNGDISIDLRTNGNSNPGSPVAAKLESGELILDSQDAITAPDYMKDYLTSKNEQFTSADQNQPPQSPLVAPVITSQHTQAQKPAPAAQGTLSSQYSSQLNLSKKLDQVIASRGAQPTLQGIQDLKSLSSGGRRASAGHLTSN